MTFILFEGPDGGGKSSAMERVLHDNPHVRRHERASDSLLGPVDDLAEWVDRTLPGIEGCAGTLDKHMVLDRHPLISELVYGPIVHPPLKGLFADPTWLRTRVRLLAAHVVVVWCIPPFAAIERNVLGMDGQHMAGVVDNIDKVYHGYHAIRGTWPGPRNYNYDYTTDDGELFRFARHITPEN